MTSTQLYWDSAASPGKPRTPMAQAASFSSTQVCNFPRPSPIFVAADGVQIWVFVMSADCSLKCLHASALSGGNCGQEQANKAIGMQSLKHMHADYKKDLHQVTHISCSTCTIIQPHHLVVYTDKYQRNTDRKTVSPCRENQIWLDTALMQHKTWHRLCLYKACVYHVM